MQTPPFLRWALEQPCPHRQQRRWREPEATERQLRALRECSRAAAQGRCFDGVCVEPLGDNANTDPRSVKGFLKHDVLQAFGGPEAAESPCRTCAANTASAIEPDALAGCFGTLPLDELLLGRISAACDNSRFLRASADLFPRTNPRCFGLWMRSPPSAKRLEALLDVLSAVTGEDERRHDAIEEFVAALRTAHAASLPLHMALYPSGRVAGESWIVNRHCPTCQADWPAAAASCTVCGFTGRPAAEQKRHTRGARPYRPLADILGIDQARRFLQRYKQQREQGACEPTAAK